MSEANLNVTDPAIVLCLFGPQDQYLRMVRNHYGVAITHRDGKVRIVGDEEAVRLATSALESLRERASRRGQLTLSEVQAVLGVGSAIAGEATAQPTPIQRRRCLRRCLDHLH